MLAVCRWLLPQGHQPDQTVSLRLKPILHNYATVLKEPQFITYALAGAFAFSGLLVYVASSPIIFMEVFHVRPQEFGAIFAGLSVGFIGSNQINVLLLRKFSSEQIFRATLLVECPVALLFLVGTMCGWFGLAGTLVLLFICAVQPRPRLSERRRAGARAVRPQHRQRLRHAGFFADQRRRPRDREHRHL
jgi:DHA1 family bicyclomycin/chloramphenicol resistance-like MFS transporter